MQFLFKIKSFDNCQLSKKALFPPKQRCCSGDLKICRCFRYVIPKLKVWDFLLLYQHLLFCVTASRNSKSKTEFLTLQKVSSNPADSKRCILNIMMCEFQYTFRCLDIHLCRPL